jgi:RNA polymerase sigma-70 factor (ECF subfamily)
MADEVNTDERRLIAESLTGRTEAFGELVVRYQDRLYHAALRIADTPEDAYDVVQDAFLNAYQSLATFKGDAEFFTWLYRIAFNAAISQKRKKKATASLDAGRNGKPIAEPADDSHGIVPGETMEQGEEEAKLYAAIRKLSTEHRTVLVMKDIDGLKYEEIAEATGVPIGTVRSRLHRARLDLRAVLESLDTNDDHSWDSAGVAQG